MVIPSATWRGGQARGSQEGHFVGRRQGRAWRRSEELLFWSLPCTRPLPSAPLHGRPGPRAARGHTQGHTPAGWPMSAAPSAQRLPSILIRGFKPQFSEGSEQSSPASLDGPWRGSDTASGHTATPPRDACVGTMYPPCVSRKGPRVHRCGQKAGVGDIMRPSHIHWSVIGRDVASYAKHGKLLFPNLLSQPLNLKVIL